MKQVFIHVGLMKTGSSFLQSFFSLNVARLSEHQILYPEFRDMSEVAKGATSSGNGKKIFKALRRTSDGHRRQNPLTALLKKSSQPTILLSSEYFAKCTREELRELRSICDGNNFKPRIIAYVRNYFDYYLSMYAQLVSARPYTGTFDEFVVTKHLPVRNQIARLIQVFEHQSVNVRCYDCVRKHIHEDFLKSMGILDSADFAVPQKIVNPTLSPEEIEVLRLLALDVGNVRLIKAATRFLRENRISNPCHGIRKMGLKSFQLIKKRHAADVDWFNRHILRDNHVMPFEFMGAFDEREPELDSDLLDAVRRHITLLSGRHPRLWGILR